MNPPAHRTGVGIHAKSGRQRKFSKVRSQERWVVMGIEGKQLRKACVELPKGLRGLLMVRTKVWSEKSTASSPKQTSVTPKSQTELRGRFPPVHSIRVFAEFLRSIASKHETPLPKYSSNRVVTQCLLRTQHLPTSVFTSAPRVSPIFRSSLEHHPFYGGSGICWSPQCGSLCSLGHLVCSLRSCFVLVFPNCFPISSLKTLVQHLPHSKNSLWWIKEIFLCIRVRDGYSSTSRRKMKGQNATKPCTLGILRSQLIFTEGLEMCQALH